MCGLIGAVGPADPAIVAWVRAGRTALAHRGPDDEGLSTHADGRVVLGHRRLSIIDVGTGGHQPMVSADGRCTIVINGEIYNYVELRRELEAKGHRFRSSSDTEVALTAYLEWGTACVSRFVGMWALAVWDDRIGRLWLSRDPFGIKPLYLATVDGALGFCSEIGPLVERAGNRLHLQVAYDFLRWGHVDRGRRSFVQGIEPLPAGTNLLVDPDRPSAAERRTYWSWPAPAGRSGLGYPEAVHAVRQALTRNVELHLRADVAIGSALSGGVDSSGIVALMRALGGPSLDLHTVSYLAAEPRIDERQWVAAMLAATGATGHEVEIAPQSVPSMIASVEQAQWEPFGSLSILAQHAVFARARAEGITVMLDGQGADELFGGYPSFAADRFAELVRHGRLRRAMQLAPVVARFGGPSAVARGLVRAAPRPLAVALWRRWMERSRTEWLDDPWFASQGVATAADAGDLPGGLAASLEAAATTTSLPALLRYEDRNSMAHSVESRVPYLTVELAELAASLPPDHLIDGDGRTKSVLRDALRGLVPDAVLDRRDKVAFSVPERRWLEDAASLLPAEPVPGLRPTPPGGALDWRALGYARFVARSGVRC